MQQRHEHKIEGKRGPSSRLNTNIDFFFGTIYSAFHIDLSPGLHLFFIQKGPNMY